MNAALNFKKKQIQIYFDENISVENPAENVLISPPQQKQPTVKGNGRIVSVDFEQDLIDSTTYTINFGNSIVDLNEKNPVENYRFSFSFIANKVIQFSFKNLFLELVKPMRMEGL